MFNGKRSVSRRYLLFLKDMLEASLKVVSFADGLPFETFVEHGMAYHAIVRLIEIVGEAAKNIPDDVRERHREVEWRRIGRARDVMAHHYFGIEDETVWEIVQEHIPELITQLESVIGQESRSSQEN